MKRATSRVAGVSRTAPARVGLALLLGTLAVSCGGRTASAQPGYVPADSLIANIDRYVDARVETEGVIAHVCGVDRKKMKLLSESGAVIAVIPHGTASFDRSLNRKRVKVYGLVKEVRLGEQYIAEREAEKALLCHVDQTPCKDTSWVNRKVETGVAESISRKNTDGLRQQMGQRQKGYVSVVHIVCEKYEVVGDKPL